MDVSTPPGTTLTASLSTYRGSHLAMHADVAGASSGGFITTALPAAIAPATGSRSTSRGRRGEGGGWGVKQREAVGEGDRKWNGEAERRDLIGSGKTQ